MKKDKRKNLLKDIFNFRIEYFVTPLFILLLILSIKYVGFDEGLNIIFNILLLIQIPLCFIGLRICRKMLYRLYIGKEV